MNIQKIQTSSNVKGFTLVELIVVITILVILGTIAFLNLGGMSGSARDSQRTSDLNQINTQIAVVQAKNGITYANLVTVSASGQLTAPTIAGALAGTAYTAGDFNYAAIGIDAAKMKDPLGKVPYKFGQTTLAGGAYELAATLEDVNGVKGALTMGIYRSRSTASTTSTGIATTTTISLTSTPSNFKVGDWLGATSQITAISSDTKTITYSGTTLAAASTFSLANPEPLGLVASYNSSNATPVTNKGTDLPYTY